VSQIDLSRCCVFCDPRRAPASHRAVFVDRDGTVIEDTGFIHKPEDVRFIDGADEALRTLIAAGYAIVVVSNQSGVARGKFTLHDMLVTHDRFVEQLRDADIELAGCYYCPFHTVGSVAEFLRESPFRKPSPGALLDAASILNLDLKYCWMIGDRWGDIRTGRAVGARTIKLPIANASASADLGDPGDTADFLADNLLAAATILLKAAS